MELERHRRQLEVMVQERTAELKLANEQQRVQIAALASAANGIIITDRDANIVWSNPAFSQLTGYESNELLGKRPSVVKSGSHCDEDSAGMWQTILSGATWKGELTNQRKDGSLYVAEVCVTPVRDDAGQICSFIAINHDITERIQVERALRDSEFRYRQMLELSPLLIALFDSEKITYINQAGAQLLGYKQPEPLIGKSIASLMDQENFQDLAELFVRLIQDPNTATSNQITRFVKLDGEVLFLDLSIAIIREIDPFQVQVIAQDITERRKAQEYLRKQAALAEIELAVNQPHELAKVLDQVVEITTIMLAASVGASVLFVDDRTGNLLIGSSNLSSVERNQLTGGHIKQNKISSWILEHKRPMIISDTRQKQLGTDMLVDNNQIRAYAGVPLIIEDQAVGVLYIMDNKPRDYGKEDIEFLTALANRASLAIAKVEIFQTLREAKDTAEAAARAKSSFLANMSHELRTPLAAITSLTELLEDSQLDRQQREFVETIQSSADRLLQLIGDVLDFSRLEASRLTLEKQVFNIRQMINDVLDMLALRASQKHVRLLISIANDVPAYMLGDDGRIAQVLINLVSNAVKFTERGYVLLRVRVQPPKAEDNPQPSHENEVLLHFSIEDTGLGIPPDQQGALFQAFSQVDSSSSRRYGGTGLGLAISKQLVELMGGDIHISSTGIPEEGSIFTFTVRVHALQDRSLPYLEADQALLKGKQLLLMDSLPISRSILEEQLSFWGIQVEAVSDTHSAAAWLAVGGEPELAVLSYSDLDCSIVAQSEALLQALSWHESSIILLHEAGKIIPEHLANHSRLKLPASNERLYDVLCQAVQIPKDAETRLPNKEIIHPTTPGNGESILLVENDPVNQKVLRLILNNLGYDVDLANNGFMALQVLEKRNYPVVIMDQQMPEMDGVTAIRIIRLVSEHEFQPFIIALTADARNEIHQSMLEAGAQVTLTKPVSRDTLASTLEQAFGPVRKAQVPTQIDPPADETINADVLSDLFKTLGSESVELHIQVLDSFLQNNPSLMEKIEQQAVHFDIDALLMSLHAMKGNCELYGANRLGNLCKGLEQDLRSKQAIELNVRIQEIGQEFNAVCTYLASIYPHQVTIAEAEVEQSKHTAGASYWHHVD